MPLKPNQINNKIEGIVKKSEANIQKLPHLIESLRVWNIFSLPLLPDQL